MQTTRLFQSVYSVWVRLHSSKHSFLGKKMFDQRSSYQFKLKSMRDNIGILYIVLLWNKLWIGSQQPLTVVIFMWKQLFQFYLKQIYEYADFTMVIMVKFKWLLLKTSIMAVSEFLPLNSQSSVSVLEVFDSSLKHCTAQADPNYNGHSVATRRIIVLAWTHHQGPPFLHYT